MKYCYHCGYRLSFGTEQFCPECGRKIEQKMMVADERDNISSIDIRATASEVIGTAISGSGNITGKEISYYNIQGATINLINPSKDAIEVLGNIKTIQTQIDIAPTSNLIEDNRDIKKAHDIIAIKQQVSQILEQVNKIEKEKGTEIKEIKAGGIQISSNELELKEILLKGNEHYYKGEYSEAIEYYDKAIQIDPNYAGAWISKGAALHKLGKSNEAIEAWDKAIQIDPNYAKAWYNKGLALYNLGKYNEAIVCYDKSLEIDPNHALAWYNKGADLQKLGKNRDASKCFDKSKKLTQKKQSFVKKLLGGY